MSAVTALAPILAEALLVLLRWLHALAAAAFLGWALVLLLEPGGGAGNSSGGASGTSRSRAFKEVTEVSLLVFLATGAVLSFDRLSRGAGGAYAVLLALKVALSVAAYQFAFRWRRGGLAPSAPDGRLVLLLGSLAVLLAAVLKALFEASRGGL